MVSAFASHFWVLCSKFGSGLPLSSSPCACLGFLWVFQLLTWLLILTCTNPGCTLPLAPRQLVYAQAQPWGKVALSTDGWSWSICDLRLDTILCNKLIRRLCSSISLVKKKKKGDLSCARYKSSQTQWIELQVILTVVLFHIVLSWK